MVQNYLEVGIFALVAVAFVAITLGIGSLLRPKHPYANKLSPYECGEEPIGEGQVRFHIRYYIFALVFLVFDVEIIFLYPWAVSFAPQTNDLGRVATSGLGLFALVEMLLFIVTVLVAYAYVWRRKGLDWD